MFNITAVYEKQPKESDRSYAIRVLEILADLDTKEWETLDVHIKAWYNINVDLINDGKKPEFEIQLLEDSETPVEEVEEVEEVTEVEEVEEEEKLGQELAEVKPEVRSSKSPSRSKTHQQLVNRACQLMILNPDASNQEIIDMVHQEFEISEGLKDVHVQGARKKIIFVMRNLMAVGKLK
jgi:carbamoylphosphate synthase small subunit